MRDKNEGEYSSQCGPRQQKTPTLSKPFIASYCDAFLLANLLSLCYYIGFSIALAAEHDFLDIIVLRIIAPPHKVRLMFLFALEGYFLFVKERHL